MSDMCKLFKRGYYCPNDFKATARKNEITT